MPFFLVGWSISGSTRVEAKDVEEAKQKVEEMGSEALMEDADDFDTNDAVIDE